MTKTSTSQSDVYQTITDQIVGMIESREAGDWEMPWHKLGKGLMRPVNVASNKPYRGVNTIALWVASEVRGFSSAIWGTYRQWAAIGAQVRKGEKSTTVVFWKSLSSTKDEAEEGGVEQTHGGMMARAFHVFNASQVDGYEQPADVGPVAVRTEIEKLESVEQFISNTRAIIRFGGDRAFYVVNSDHIQLPERHQFADSFGFYSTALHELGHWTGHATRCNRAFGKRFGDAAYAAEELVAELTASFLCADQHHPA